MATNSLETFLKGGQPPEPETPSASPPEGAGAVPAAAEPSGEPDSAQAAPEAADGATPAEGATPAPEAGGERMVPLAALEGERRQRQDWKGRAERAETEASGLRKQLEEAKRAPVAPPNGATSPAAHPPAPQIDPATDPRGYFNAMQQEFARTILNERLNSSERQARQELGADKVDAMIAEFKSAAEADPALYGKLYTQPHPYGWLAGEMERIRIARDPAAYREQVRAEIAAELAKGNGANGAAAANGGTPPASPAAGMQPSLATVRSAMPRSSTAFTGPPPLDAIVGQRHHRRAQ